MGEKPPPAHDERMSVQLIEALTRIWTKIRSFHPAVPPVVILAAPAHRDQVNVLGHFAALRWSGRRTGDRHLHEVVVVAEHLDRSAEEVAETILHEAAHSMNYERGVAESRIARGVSIIIRSSRRRPKSWAWR